VTEDQLSLFQIAGRHFEAHLIALCVGKSVGKSIAKSEAVK
jgi:hypothetical protein